MTYEEWQGIVTEYGDDVDGRLKKAKALDRFKDYIWVYYRQEVEAIYMQARKMADQHLEFLEEIIDNVRADIDENIKAAGTLPEGIYEILENDPDYEYKNDLRDSYNASSKKDRDEALFVLDNSGNASARVNIDFAPKGLTGKARDLLGAISEDYKLLKATTGQDNELNNRAEFLQKVYERMCQNIDAFRSEEGNDYEERKGLSFLRNTLDGFISHGFERTRSVVISNEIVEKADNIKNNQMINANGENDNSSEELKGFQQILAGDKDRYNELHTMAEGIKSYDEAKAAMKVIMDKKGEGTFDEIERNIKELSSIRDNTFRNAYDSHIKYAKEIYESDKNKSDMFKGLEKKMKKAGFMNQNALMKHTFQEEEMASPVNRELYVYSTYLRYMDTLKKIKEMKNPIKDTDKPLGFNDRSLYLMLGPDMLIRNAIGQLGFREDFLSKAEKKKYKEFLSRINEVNTFSNYIFNSLADDEGMVEKHLELLGDALKAKKKEKVNKIEKEDKKEDVKKSEKKAEKAGANEKNTDAVKKSSKKQDVARQKIKLSEIDEENKAANKVLPRVKNHEKKHEKKNENVPELKRDNELVLKPKK